MSVLADDKDFTESCLQQALAYAKQGLRVFPVHSAVTVEGKLVCTCRRPGCDRAAKHPRTKAGFTEATSDEATIRAWWEQWPISNIGVATGGGFFVLDVDPKSGGDDSLAELIKEHGPLPDTLAVITGGGGMHYYFSTSEKVQNSVSLVGPGLDIRGEGGYVLISPSRHISGGVYAHDLGAAETPALAPNWLFRLATKKRANARSESHEQISQASVFIGGARNLSLTSLAGSMRKRGMSQEAIFVAIATENEQKCKPPLDEREVRRIADSVSKYKPDDPILGTVIKDGESEADKTDWKSKLAYNDKNKLVASGFNASLVLRHAEEWADVLAYDEFHEKVIWLNTAPGFGGIGAPGHDEWSPRAGERFRDGHVLYVQHWLQMRYDVKFNVANLFLAIEECARMRSFHPVRSYLKPLPWDGLDRMSTWLPRLFSVEDTPYARAVSRGFLISAVARVMIPGCKADHVLVLEGKQGKKKSSAMRALFGEEWFLERLPSLQNEKDAAQVLPGHWGIEIPELDAMKGASATRIKSFISLTNDDLRKSYGRFAIRQPRQCVFVATTNERDWNEDPTGGRRFWPVFIRDKINIDGVRSERDQLWAQARIAFESGEPWWPSEEMEATFFAEQEKRYQVDEWEDHIVAWLDGREACIASRIYEHALKFSRDRIDRRAQARVGAIMHRLGYVRRRLTVSGHKESYFCKVGSRYETTDGYNMAFLEFDYERSKAAAGGGSGHQRDQGGAGDAQPR